jgi:hypothetical protein
MQSIPRIEPVCTAAARLSWSDGLDQRRLARHRCFEYSGDACRDSGLSRTATVGRKGEFAGGRHLWGGRRMVRVELNL